MKVVGVVGLNGSGKDEVVHYLHARYGIPALSTGDMVRQMAREQGLPPTRDNLHRLSERCFAERGRDYFAKRAIRAIEDNRWDIVGISGIRTPSDVTALRQRFGDDFVLVYVQVTDDRARYQRAKHGAEARDPQTYQAFLRQDESEEEIFSLDETISKADVVINNDGDLGDLHSQIDHLLVPAIVEVEADGAASLHPT